MKNKKQDIYVYAHWLGMAKPVCIGVLSAQQAKGKKAFSFTYDDEWLKSKEQLILDPDIGWYAGVQYPNEKKNFGLFLDSMPDRWGRTLMKRRAAQLAKLEDEASSTLYDIDYLLGVQDESRMGALRFKLEKEGPFIANNDKIPVPPLSSLRELQQAAKLVETDEDIKDIKKWLAILIAPGSSLGGARPKANVKDEKGQLWIAKFPSKNDDLDKGAWEYLAYQLALNAGIEMAPSKILKVAGRQYTFLTKRFDRKGKQRIHFASAMTMTGNNEDTIKENHPSYLDLAEFIQFSGGNVQADLQQLWRRIVFNIGVSNTDDHLRNHGFILNENGWILSPAFDINPSIEKDGLALNIDGNDNSLDIELAKSIGEYFQLSLKEMNRIIKEVNKSITNWQTVASQIGISRKEQKMMTTAFKMK